MTLLHTQAVILAAGKGSRMGDLPYQKSMLPAKTGKHIIAYALKSLFQSGFDNLHITTVVGHKKDSIKSYIGADSQYTDQEDLAGTADAVQKVASTLNDSISNLLVLNGDDSLSCTKEVLQAILEQHINSKDMITIGVTDEYVPSVHKQAYVPASSTSLSSIVPVEKQRGYYLNGICMMNIAYIRSLIDDLALCRSDNNKEFGIPHLYKKALADNVPIGICQAAYKVSAMNTIDDWKRNMEQ